MIDLINRLSPGYTGEQYFLFLLALLAIFMGLALIAGINSLSDWYKLRRSELRMEQMKSRGRYEELRRKHANYLAQMDEVLESIKKGA